MARLSNIKKEAIIKDLKAKRIGVQKIAEKHGTTVYTVKKLKAELLGKQVPKPTPQLEPKSEPKREPKVRKIKVVELKDKDLKSSKTDYVDYDLQKEVIGGARIAAFAFACVMVTLIIVAAVILFNVIK